MWLICPDTPQVSRLQRTKAQNMSLLAAERLAPSLGSSHQKQHHCLHLSGGECPPSPLTLLTLPLFSTVCVCVWVTMSIFTIKCRKITLMLSELCSCVRLLNDTCTDKHDTLTQQSPLLISLLLSPSLVLLPLGCCHGDRPHCG